MSGIFYGNKNIISSIPTPNNNNVVIFNSSTGKWEAYNSFSGNILLQDSSVNYSKIQNVTASKFLVRYSTNNGSIQEGTFGTGFSLNSSTGVLIINENQINHNNLGNYVNEEHINHSLVSISGGNGLSGGGDLTVSRTIELGTPSSITTSSNNSVSGTTHTHSIIGFTPSSRVISTGVGLNGGGDLTTNRVISLADTAVIPGIYTKVSVNQQGQVTNGASLLNSDIPNLDASKITTGILPIARGGTGSTTQNFVDLTTAQNIAGVKTFTAGSVVLSNATSNFINFGTNGLAAPTFSSRSAGTKLVLRSSLSASAVDYGIGVENSNLWFSTAEVTTGFRWYAGNTNIASLSGFGALSLNIPLAISNGGTGNKVKSFVDLSTSQIIEGIKTFKDGQLILNNTISNLFLIDSTAGTAAPTLNTRSTGSKVVLFPSLGSTTTDYAFGIETNNLWSSVPQSNSTFGFKWYAGTTEIARLNGLGELSLQGLTVSTPPLSTGYKFTNTTSSSDPNTLDYYQEGIFTPIFSTDTSGVTYTYLAQSGYYTLIGRVLFINIFITISAASGGTPSGSLKITGLPYPISTNSNSVFSATVGFFNGLVNQNQYISALIAKVSSVDTIIFYKQNNSQLQASDLSSTSVGFRLSGFYFI